MKRASTWVAALLLLGTMSAAQAQDKTFFWVSHGSPADPVWTYFLDGARQWGEDTGNEVNTSFHSGDVPSHQEAIRAAIASGADGIVTSSPDPGSLVAAHCSSSVCACATPRLALREACSTISGSSRSKHRY